jgi:hypothetical protein
MNGDLATRSDAYREHALKNYRQEAAQDLHFTLTKRPAHEKVG